MRIFVYEHITGGGLAGMDLPPALAREGGAMLEALLADLDLAGAQLLTTRDNRLAPLSANAALVSVASNKDRETAWRHALDWADAVWPIAPESDGILAALSRRILDAKRILLGSSPEAVALTTSKLATYRCLHNAGVKTVPTWPLQAPQTPPPWVVKPDDGAGCENTRLLPTHDDLITWSGSTAAPQRYVLQPFRRGAATSLSLLCHAGRARVLSHNRQRVEISASSFRFHGATAAATDHQSPHQQQLANAIARAIPGLWGYIGVDLLHADGGAEVLEINPRLTVSYTTIRPVLGINPAALVLSLLEHSPAR